MQSNYAIGSNSCSPKLSGEHPSGCMNINRRSVGALAGAAALAFAFGRRQRIKKGTRELKGKVVLITGGSRGLGYAIALELASLGARLVLTSRHVNELERAKA